MYLGIYSLHFFDIEIFRIDLKNKLVDNFRGMET